MIAPRMGKVLTMPEVAAIAGWDRRRMLRHLLRLHAELGGMLLHNVGSKAKPRWTVTLDALQKAAPAWFLDPVAVQARLDALEGDVRHLRRVSVEHTRAIASMTSPT